MFSWYAVLSTGAEIVEDAHVVFSFSVGTLSGVCDVC